MEDLASLITFVRERYDEIESIARAAKGRTSGEWSDFGKAGLITLHDESGTITVEDHRHIATQDPARTLRRLDGLRLIVNRCVATLEVLERDDDHATLNNAHFVLHALALEFADHSGYRLEWAVPRHPRPVTGRS
ncbi:DUF6221 family protein [Amycolatopsis sp. NPDC049868]|uniref:DUF6221 family protein n=1 Tax=Amycolatopsis sp. NPDC049868 TaxID=3363934 RepID=UPI0037AB3EE0